MPMAFLLSWGLVLFHQRGSWVVKVPLNLLFFANLLGSRSRAGMIGSAIGLFGLLVFGRARLREAWKIVAILFLFYGTLVFGMDYFTLKNPETIRLLDNLSSEKIENTLPIVGDFQSLVLGTDSLELAFSNATLSVEVKEGKCRFLDQGGEEIPYQLHGHRVIPAAGKLRGFRLKLDSEKKLLQVTREWHTLNFLHTLQGFKILDGLGRPSSLLPVEKWGFRDRDRWGNGRGFIWARSFPLAWKALFCGYGPDTYVLYFPQNDFLAKIRAGYSVGWLVDKPHNLFLQTAINTGGISLLALIALFGRYIFSSLWSLSKFGVVGFPGEAGATVTMAVLAYLVTGFFNDSSVSVAPVFWVLLGTGIGLLGRRENTR
jgi:hypothetical protein